MSVLKSKYLKSLNVIAIPLIIQNIASILIGFVDEMFLGRISIEAYGSIGITLSLFSQITGVLGCISVAFNIKGAQCKGENDDEGFNTLFLSSIILNVILGLLFFIFIFVFGEKIFTKLYGLNGTALNEAMTYAFIVSPYVLFNLLLFSFNSFFKIIKKTKVLMVVSTISSVMNTVLDYVLIFGKFGFPELKTKGAALATIISLLFNFVVLAIYAFKYNKLHFTKLKSYVSGSVKLIKESLPLMGSELLEGCIFVTAINAIISNIGILEISAYLLVETIIDLIFISTYMYGNAEMTLISESLGKKDFLGIKGLLFTGMKISTFIYIILGFISILLKNKIPALITDEIDLINFATKMIIPMVFIDIFRPAHVILTYGLQALNKSNYVLYVSAVVNAIALILIFILVGNKLGLTAVYIGMFLNHVVLYIIYQRKFNKLISQPNIIQ